ncbi:MAG: ROK family transcriptional regulator [Chloroflexi bacterium]|nr:ROK family transcriptional regulator [Chloroflexota bacterium]
MPSTARPRRTQPIHVTTASMRAANRAALVAAVRRHGPITRSALSEWTGLSKGAVSSLVAELLRDGVLYEEDAAAGGRNRALHLNRALGVALGIELGTSECRGIATDVAMNPVRRSLQPVTSVTVEASIGLIAAMARQLLEGETRPCLGLAVALPALTDAEGQRVVFSEGLGWSDVPLAGRLSDILGVPVRVTNRPRAGAMGEHWYGAGVGVDDMVYVSVSDGIAAGAFIEGRPLIGATGYGGEFGHTTVLLDGPPCVCGNRGCLETVASLPAIRQAIRQRVRVGADTSLREPIAYRDIIAAVRDGDALALGEVRRASEYLGVGVANLINLFNPSLVIIGGYLAEAGEMVIHSIRKAAQRRAFPVSYRHVQIQRNALSLDSACVGACALVVNGYIAGLEPALCGSPWG